MTFSRQQLLALLTLSLRSINNLHDNIDAHNQATEAAIRGRKEAELQEAATKRIADAVNRTNNAYRDEAATVDMTSDELEIYRLKMMGATQEQLDSVTATQQATKAFRKQGSAAKGAPRAIALDARRIRTVRSSGTGCCGPASDGSERAPILWSAGFPGCFSCLVRTVPLIGAVLL